MIMYMHSDKALEDCGAWDVQTFGPEVFLQTWAALASARDGDHVVDRLSADEAEALAQALLAAAKEIREAMV